MIKLSKMVSRLPTVNRTFPEIYVGPGNKAEHVAVSQ